MKRVATAVVLIPLVLLLVFKGPFWVMALVLALIAFLATSEYLTIVEAHGIQPLRRLTLASVLICFLLPVAHNFALPLRRLVTYYDLQSLSLVWIFLLAPLVFLGAAMSRADLRECLLAAAVSQLGLLYVGGTLFSLWTIWVNNFGSLLVFHLLVVVWSGDIFAYYVGKSFGRRRLAPTISPNKTWEGAAASLATSTFLGTLILVGLSPLYDWLFRLDLVPPIGYVGWSSPLPTFPIWFALAASAAINVAAQIGDLAESALKRGANLKDSGAMLPGHGGMLDRIDALLFASPVSMLVFAIGTNLFGSDLVF